MVVIIEAFILLKVVRGKFFKVFEELNDNKLYLYDILEFVKYICIYYFVWY